MAENKQEKRTFKWGDNEYLLDDLLKLHTDQERNYYNFARDRGKYDDTALAGLRSAIGSRLNSIKSGEAFEGDGAHSSDKVDNTRIQTQKKGLFKKEKYVDQDNTEWAKYYFSKLVGQLKPYEREAAKEKGGWDLSKHGLSAYLTGQGLNAQDIFEKYDGRDKNNPDAARGFAQRRELLKQYLTNYNDYVNGKGFDFSKNDNEWDDAFKSDLSDTLTNFDNLDNNALLARLRKLGAGDYAQAFTSDRWDLTKTNEDLDVEAEARKREKADKQRNDDYKIAEDWARSQKRNFETQVSPYDYSGYDFEGRTPNFFNWYGNLGYENGEQTDRGTYLGINEDTWKKAWNNLMNTWRTGGQYTDKNLSDLLQGTFENTKDAGFIDLGDGHYLIKDSYSDNGQGMVYNPTTGYVSSVFLGDIANRNSAITQAYKDILNRRIYNTVGRDYNEPTYTFAHKEGGELIPKHQYGSNVVYNFDSFEEVNRKKAKANNKTEKEQKAADRYTNEKNRSDLNPDAGWTATDTARLATIAADITSMFLDPVSGTAVGLGSTLTNFALDIKEDGYQGKDLKNLAVSAGFDLLGAIPIFGDALGTGSKITRNVAKWAPRIAASIATMSGVANAPQILESLGKATDGDAETKMTVQDWRNIAQGIGLVTGITRGVRNKVASENIKKQAKVQDVVGVNVRDANGEVKQLLVDGDAAKNIRKAAGNRAEIEAELNKLEPYKNKFGDGKEFQVDTKGKGKWQNPYSKEGSADGSRQWRGFRAEGRAAVTDVYDFSKVKNYSNRYRNIAEGVNKDVSIDKTITNAKQSTIDAVKAQGNNIQQKVNKIKDWRTKVESDITTTKNKIEELQKNTNGLDETKLKEELETSGIAADRKEIIDAYLKNFTDLRNMQKRLTRRERQKSRTFETSGTSEYSKLMNMLNNPSNYQVGNKLLSFDGSSILKSMNLPTTFKEGGSINRNKINKFINYAKG